MDSGADYRGSNTGVYFAQLYFAQLLTSTGELIDDRYGINNFHGLGKCIALRANRVSFTFDLRGPSLTVDTGERFVTISQVFLILLVLYLACSSAATAMHLALSAIKLGDINQALIISAYKFVVVLRRNVDLIIQSFRRKHYRSSSAHGGLLQTWRFVSHRFLQVFRCCS
jgi:hypothetical protein